ncbi:MAG: TrmH family RNA methyltransferase [Schleiferiaceae bacterium]|nr:TrmH family RNA methyltransferase [Schleiferiaceae bacterium]
MRKLLNSELKRIDVAVFQKTQKTPIIVVLDHVRSLHNVGSIFRTADAFLIQEMLLVGISATPPNKEIDKTALGATQSVAWQFFEQDVDAIQYLRNNGYTIVLIEQMDAAIPLDQFQHNPEQKLAVVFGHEVKGVSGNWLQAADAAIEIPMLGTKHSFNVAVSAGMVLWELGKKYLP